jgi:hypothetical protein
MPKEAQIERVEVGVQRGFEQHKDVNDCRDFALTEQQIRSFLANARVITRMEEHDQFDWAPCVVRGTLKWRKGQARFEISATLVGSVFFEGAREVRLGCDERCEKIVYPP